MKHAVLILSIAAVGCTGGGGGDGGGGFGTIPTEFEFLRSVSYPGEDLTGVAVDAGRSLAFTAGFDFLEVYDITDPLNPAFQGDSSVPAFPEDVEISGSTAYLQSSSALEVFDVSNPLAPGFVTSFTRGGLSLTAVGDRLYAAEGEEGLAIYSIEDTEEPLLLGTADTPGSAASVAVLGSFAYVGDTLEGLRVVEIGDGTSPALRGSLPAPTDSTCGTQFLGCNGAHCFVSQCVADPQVVDVSNPDVPSVVGTLSLDLSTRRAWMGDGYGVITRGQHLLLVDLRDPEAPAVLDDWDLGGDPAENVRDIDVDSDLLAVASASEFALFRLVSDSSGAGVQ